MISPKRLSAYESEESFKSVFGDLAPSLALFADGIKNLNEFASRWYTVKEVAFL